MSGNGKLEKLISMSELTEKLGLSRSTIYVMMGEGTFPSPIKIGSKRIAWRVATIDKWITEREEL